MAIIFNGTSQYAYADESFSANAGSADQTLAFFVRPQTLAVTGYPVGVNDSVGTFQFFTARMEPTSDIAGRHKATNSILTAYTTLTNDAWSPIVVTFDDATNTCTIYPASTTGVSASDVANIITWDRATVGAILGAGTTPADYFKGKLAYAMYFERKWTAGEISTFINASSVADINGISTANRVFRYDLISDLSADGAGIGLTGVNSPTFDADEPFAAGGGVTVTDVDTDEDIYPGQTLVTITGTGFGATQSTGSVDINGVAQTVTSWSDTSIQITAVQGNNPYGSRVLQVTNSLAESGTISITLSPNTASGFGYVTAASPITNDPASVFYNTTPVVVDGDQFEWEDNNNLGNLTIGANGLITNVDTEGNFQGRIWDDTDDTWGTPATFTAAVPDAVGPVVTSVTPPASSTYAPGQNIDITVNWDEFVYVVGSPQLNIIVGAASKQAAYLSGDGSSALVFRYTVQSGDLDTDGIGVSSLVLNGGTIKDISDNDATLTLNSIGDFSGVLVDGVAPIVTINDLTTSDTTPLISGTCNDDAATVTVNVNAVDYFPVVSGGTWTQQLPELSINTYPMTADAVDAVGNNAVQDTATLTITEVPEAFAGTRGNMNKIRLMNTEFGINSGSMNLREIKYWQAKGATSSQYNMAKKEAGELL